MKAYLFSGYFYSKKIVFQLSFTPQELLLSLVLLHFLLVFSHYVLEYSQKIIFGQLGSEECLVDWQVSQVDMRDKERELDCLDILLTFSKI